MGLLLPRPLLVTLLWVRVSVIHPFYVASHCSLFRRKNIQGVQSSQLYDLLIVLNFHSPLASVGPNNIFLRIFISEESIVFANIPRFTNFPLVPLLRDDSDNETCVFSLFMYKENPLVSDKHTITTVNDFRLLRLCTYYQIKCVLVKD